MTSKQERVVQKKGVVMNRGMELQEALRNFYALQSSPYPGQGIVVGLDETGEFLVQVFWIMGLGDDSRNRVFVKALDGLVATEAADPAKIEDLSLIIYDAMVEGKGTCGQEPFGVVGNGSQTNRVAEQIHNQSFCELLEGYTYEPDAPNYTPRITAVSFWEDNLPKAKMSILRKSSWGKECDRHQYGFGALSSGFGHCITTYSGNGKPLPSFRGEPLLVPLLLGDIQEVAEAYWSVLNLDNRVSLAVKFIPRRGGSETVLINKYRRSGEVV